MSGFETVEMKELLILLLGVVPWHISRTPMRRRGRIQGMRWRIAALFWQLTVERPTRGKVRWRFTMPAIQRLYSIIWAALEALIR
ncbi:MAG: hypothetical protein KDD92_01865 [Caldilineaceae bacterium]|nr:hypothetical protein [Caldilineaceae bacterium]